MGVRTGDRVSGVDVVESHVSLLVVVRNGPVHGFHWMLRVLELAAGRRLRAAHHVVLLLLDHLVPRSMVAGNSWSLYCADLTSDSVPSVHHLVEHLLLRGIGICLVLVADGHRAVARIVANAKEVCPRVVAAIGLRMVRVLIHRSHVATRSLFRTN